MHIVIYSFHVKEGKHLQFEQAWKKLTELIYQYEGSLGSRLHQKDQEHYIAYAQWPSKQIFENAGSKLHPETDEVRKAMRESCIDIQTLHELALVDDLLANTTYNK
jgi:heme-degrading monooxygenase HmoA